MPAPSGRRQGAKAGGDPLRRGRFAAAGKDGAAASLCSSGASQPVASAAVWLCLALDAPLREQVDVNQGSLGGSRRCCCCCCCRRGKWLPMQPPPPARALLLPSTTLPLAR
ncbi:Hypothetical predicted protein [Podarcis lilfordi]|uniref:Uncharacterized protein n=1 Tax=Podarcis lilfordi TaxID=74358 RepID=A0AA35K3A1_9SAUR|nr:Hypothetical predicted protein [Podarcis lilfordi]